MITFAIYERYTLAETRVCTEARFKIGKLPTYGLQPSEEDAQDFIWAEVERQGDDFYILPISAAVRLNGNKIVRTKLQCGDELRLGDGDVTICVHKISEPSKRPIAFEGAIYERVFSTLNVSQIWGLHNRNLLHCRGTHAIHLAKCVVTRTPLPPLFVWRDLDSSTGDCAYHVIGEGDTVRSVLAYLAGEFDADIMSLGTRSAEAARDIWKYEFLVEYLAGDTLEEARAEYARIRDMQKA